MDTPPPPAMPPNLSDDESRKKYIRTFAGDMEIVKKGGTPDLKPLEDVPPTPFAGAKETIAFMPVASAPEPTPPPVEAPVPPPPAPPPPPVVKPIPPAPPPPPINPLPPPAEPDPEPVIITEDPQPEPPPLGPDEFPHPVLAETVAPSIPIVPIQFPEPTGVNAPEINSSPLETYRDDFLQKVKDTDASTATVLAAEQDAGGDPSPVEPPAKKGISRMGILSIIGGVVLLIGAGVGVYIGYTHYSAQNAPVMLTGSVSSPIFVDASEEISGQTPAALEEAIITSMNETLAPNTVRLLYTASATTTGNDIFSALGFAAPGILLRNINAAQSMAGIVNTNGIQSPFFILSVASYQDTFAGMLQWESTMLNNVSILFPLYTTAISTTATTTQATSTTKTIAPPVAKTATSTPATALVFKDQVVDNHDVRIYTDAQGRSILVYGYWNKTTLVIARDPSAFTQILTRLATANTQ